MSKGKSNYTAKLKADPAFWAERQERIVAIAERVATESPKQQQEPFRVCRVCGTLYTGSSHPRCWRCRKEGKK